MVSNRPCLWCGAPVQRATQARYCRRSHRQRAYEARVAAIEARDAAAAEKARETPLIHVLIDQAERRKPLDVLVWPIVGRVVR